MSGERDDDRALAIYVRTIETRFRQLRGSARVVSPREFALMLEWYESGVPAEVVLTALDETLGAQGGDEVLSLSYLRRPVERHFRSFRSARLGESGEGGGRTALSGEEIAAYLASAAEALRRAGAERAGAGALEALVGKLGALTDELSREGAARNLEELEGRLAALDAELLEAARDLLGPEESARLETQARDALRPHRSLMSERVHRRTVERQSARLLRQALGLPELSLFAI